MKKQENIFFKKIWTYFFLGPLLIKNDTVTGARKMLK